MAEVVIDGLYRHFKGGEYRVICLARDANTEDWYVVYKSTSSGDKWLRREAEFLETITRDGKEVRRFEYME
jgi:hypothetical protein